MAGSEGDGAGDSLQSPLVVKGKREGADSSMPEGSDVSGGQEREESVDGEHDGRIKGGKVGNGGHGSKAGMKRKGKKVSAAGGKRASAGKSKKGGKQAKKAFNKKNQQA